MTQRCPHLYRAFCISPWLCAAPASILPLHSRCSCLRLFFVCWLVSACSCVFGLRRAWRYGAAKHLHCAGMGNSASYSTYAIWCMVDICRRTRTTYRNGHCSIRSLVRCTIHSYLQVTTWRNGGRRDAASPVSCCSRLALKTVPATL